MKYVCVQARFLFFNGVKRYTVEFAYGIMTWFILEDEATTGCVFQKKINPKKSKTPTRDLAEDVLEEYLEKQSATI